MEGGLARIPFETGFKVEVIYHLFCSNICADEWRTMSMDKMMEICQDLQRTTFNVKVMQSGSSGEKHWTLAPPKGPLSSQRRYELFQKMTEKLFDKKPFLETKTEQSDGKEVEKVPYGTELLHLVEGNAREEGTPNNIMSSSSSHVYTEQERKAKGCLPVKGCQTGLKVNEKETQPFKKCASIWATSSNSGHVLTGGKFGDISPVEESCKPPSLCNLTAQSSSVPQTLTRERVKPTANSAEAKGTDGWESTSESGYVLTGDRFGDISPVKRCGGLSSVGTKVSAALSVRRRGAGRGRPIEAPTSICSKAEGKLHWEFSSNSLEYKRGSSSSIASEFVPDAAVGDNQGGCSSDDSSPAPSTPVESDSSDQSCILQSSTRWEKGGEIFGDISPIECTPMHSVDSGHVPYRATDEHGAPALEAMAKLRVNNNVGSYNEKI